MIVRYTLDDAASWARFSGDKNPLHFDNHYAQRRGCEAAIAHGMRVMLSLKKALSETLLQESPASAFYRFNARLHQPVYYDRPYQLGVTQSETRISASISDEQDQSCMTARLAPVVTPVNRQCADALPLTGLLPQETLFPGNAATAAERWSFLDAALFQRLLAESNLAEVVNALDASCNVVSVDDLFTRFQVIHTHHEVLFSSELLGTAPPATPLFSLRPSEGVGDLQSGLIISIESVIYGAQGQTLLTSAATLRICQ